MTVFYCIYSYVYSHFCRKKCHCKKAGPDMKHFFFVSSRIHSVYSDLLTIGYISLYSADIRENDKQKKFVSTYFYGLYVPSVSHLTEDLNLKCIRRLDKSKRYNEHLMHVKVTLCVQKTVKIQSFVVQLKICFLLYLKHVIYLKLLHKFGIKN